MGELSESGIRDVEIRWEGNKPAIVESPVVALREREGETSWEAWFEMELEAVVPERGQRQSRRREPGDPLLQALALGLGPGQRLELRFRSRGARRGGEREWIVVGRSRDTSSEDALGACDVLRATVAATLESFGKNLRFRTVAEPVAVDGFRRGRHTELHPTGVALHRPGGERRVGFVTGGQGSGDEARVVALSPAPGAAPPYPGLALASVLELPASVAVGLTLEAVHLDPEDLRTLAAVYTWLTDGEPKRLGVRPGFGAEVDDPEMLDRLKKSLEGWIRTGRGVRLGCQVCSRDPVPPGLLAVVGKELFGGCAFEVRDAQDGVAEDRGGLPITASGPVLDLRGCLAASFPLPRVLPTGEALLRAGVPQEHVTTMGHLPAQGLLLGRVGEGSGARDVRFPAAERSRHAYLIGATGTGKSTLLLRMLVQDMEAGEGVCLIDPHGDLYQQALESVPLHRAKDVVLVDAADFAHPVGINLLEVGEGAHRAVQINFAINEMIRIFDRLYNLRETGGPIFEQYMRGALQLALESEHPGATLMDVPWIFEDRDYRAFLKEKCTNPLVVSFWDLQAERAGGDASLHSVAPYVTSKLNQFTANALLRPVIGQPVSTVDFRTAMDRGQIVLVNLSKGLLGELDSRLLGMLVIGKIFAAALGRAAAPARERRPFYLYIDEFQNVTTDTVADMLAEARKYGLHLTLANQNLSQIHLERGPNLQQALLGNVGTLIAFRLGPDDAEKLKGYTRPEIDAAGLQELPNFHAAARLLVNGAPLRPFVFHTLPAARRHDCARVRHLVAASRRSFTRPREAVEKAILKRRESWKEHG